MLDLFRLYDAADAGSDGYPVAWHQHIKHLVRAEAGHRCVRCKHPYKSGEHGRGEWSPCDEECIHGMPARDLAHPFGSFGSGTTTGGLMVESRAWTADGSYGRTIEARWRILTVHHLLGPGSELDCRWFNLVALCQRCHLSVQSRVKLDRPYFLEHSDWFKPYVAGYYALSYLGEELTREQVVARMDELLGLACATREVANG